jgi:signal peptidase I
VKAPDGFIRLIVALALAVALALCLRRWVCITVRVAGTSMQDTL